jgi:hypothetical protein
MTTSYLIGDPVRISDAHGESFAVVVGTPDLSTVEVQMLEKGVDHMYHIGSDCYHVDVANVVEHHELHGDDDLAPRAFDTLGFRMIDGGTFVKHSDEVGEHMFPIGEGAFDPRSDDDEEPEDPTLGGFIVPDAECEPFTHARADNDFVRDTHAAVRAFNEWVPKNEQEAQARSFMIRQEARASRLDDDARFSRNMAGVSYRNPL